MNKENLPIEVDNNKSLAKKRKEKRLIEEIKKSGKVAIMAGIAVAGLTVAISASTMPIVIAGYVAFGGFGAGAFKKIAYKPAGKESVFLFHRNRKGELEIGQDSTKVRQTQKIKSLKPAEKAASMGLGMIVSLGNIQQMYVDEEIETKPSKDGKSNVYPQVFSAVTHGDNIKTLEALETLGYIQINRKNFKKKSIFVFERLGFGENEAARKAFLSQFNPEERKKYEHDFFDIAIQVTDKKLNIDELVQKYNNVNQIDRSNTQERKALKTVGLIFRALKNSKIDVRVNELGESQIVYDSDRSLLTRVQEESTDKCEEYRKKIYVGNEIEQTPVQAKDQNEITQENVTKNQQNKDEEIEH